MNTTVTQTFTTQSRCSSWKSARNCTSGRLFRTDGMIRMEIHPELSTGQVVVQNGFTLPQKEMTQVTTNVMCRDGCTVVIGGLMREDLTKRNGQLPVLGSLPGVGFLFRNTDQTIARSEVLVLLTPRIVYDPEYAKESTTRPIRSAAASRSWPTSCRRSAPFTWRGSMFAARKWPWPPAIRSGAPISPSLRSGSIQKTRRPSSCEPISKSKFCPGPCEAEWRCPPSPGRTPPKGGSVEPWMIDG